MRFFTRFNRRSAIARLVIAGMIDQQNPGRRSISNAIYLLEGSLGDSFASLQPQAAAGVTLLALAKNSTLGHCLNDGGWSLVLATIDDQPEIAARLSPAATVEIARRRPAMPGTAIPQAA